MCQSPTGSKVGRNEKRYGVTQIATQNSFNFMTSWMTFKFFLVTVVCLLHFLVFKIIKPTMQNRMDLAMVFRFRERIDDGFLVGLGKESIHHCIIA